LYKENEKIIIFTLLKVHLAHGDYLGKCEEHDDNERAKKEKRG